MMFNKIRWRITIPYVALIILTTISLGIYITNFIRQSYITNLTNFLFIQANTFQYLSDGATFFEDGTKDLNAIAIAWSNIIDARVTFISPEGVVLGESHGDINRMDNHLKRPEVAQAISEGQGSSIRFSHTEGENFLYVAIPIVSRDEHIAGFIRLSIPLRQIELQINQFKAAIIGISTIATAIAILLAAWIAGRTTRPLRELTKATDRITSGDLESHLIPTTSDEVGQLTYAFNLMAGRIRDQISELESERGKLAAVLSEMSDGVLIVDDQGKIRLFNPAALKIFAINETDINGKSIIEALRQHQIVELWRSCLGSNETQAILLEIPAKKVYLQIVATPLLSDPPARTLLLFQNLSKIKHLENIRQDFMSNISHELRTPLASLKALTETLQESAMDDPPAARRFLQRMETEVDALSLMVSELLELSRIESGRVPMKLKPVSPLDLMTNAVDRLNLQVERANLTLTIDCLPSLPAILADPTKLEQVIMNLLHNAVKFTPAGGTIRFVAFQSGGNIQFSVIDAGIGIRQEDLNRIFERFYKIDRSRSGGGTGLGLAIARHHVEAHGGSIWAESTEGQGSAFHFTIPLAH